MDQWTRIKSPEINPYTYCQSLQQVMLESWTVTCKSMKSEHTLTSYTKINSKWLQYLNISHHTMKLLEENILLHKSYQCFLRSVFKVNRNKSKNKWDLNLQAFAQERKP